MQGWYRDRGETVEIWRSNGKAMAKQWRWRRIRQRNGTEMVERRQRDRRERVGRDGGETLGRERVEG